MTVQGLVEVPRHNESALLQAVAHTVRLVAATAARLTALFDNAARPCMHNCGGCLLRTLTPCLLACLLTYGFACS